MHYLIDGYNLLHATGHLVGKVSPDRLERARRTLLDHIVTHLGPEARRVTVVFDARRAPRSTPAEEHYDGIRVLYALDAEADDLIEVLIRTEPTPRKLTVVTQDRRLLEAAARRRCLTQAGVDFYDGITLSRRPEPAQLPPLADKPQVLSKEEAADLLRAFGDLRE